MNDFEITVCVAFSNTSITYTVALYRVRVEKERGGTYRVLMGNPDEKRPLGTPRQRWEDNIKIDL
jgi:hypothetical protein